MKLSEVIEGVLAGGAVSDAAKSLLENGKPLEESPRPKLDEAYGGAEDEDTPVDILIDALTGALKRNGFRVWPAKESRGGRIVGIEIQHYETDQMFGIVIKRTS